MENHLKVYRTSIPHTSGVHTQLALHSVGQNAFAWPQATAREKSFSYVNTR